MKTINKAELTRSAHLANVPETIQIGGEEVSLVKALSDAAKQRKWVGVEIDMAVEAVQDQRISEAARRATLAGEEDPITLDPEGEPQVSLATVNRNIRQAKKASSHLAYLSYLRAGTYLMLTPVETLVVEVGPEEVERDRATLEGFIAYLQSLLAAAGARPKLKVLD